MLRLHSLVLEAHRCVRLFHLSSVYCRDKLDLEIRTKAVKPKKQEVKRPPRSSEFKNARQVRRIQRWIRKKEIREVQLLRSEEVRKLRLEKRARKHTRMRERFEVSLRTLDPSTARVIKQQQTPEQQEAERLRYEQSLLDLRRERESEADTVNRTTN